MSAKKRKPKNDYTEALWAKLYRPMIEKKYELLKDDYIEISGVKLYRIRALVDFNDVKKGDFAIGLIYQRTKRYSLVRGLMGMKKLAIL